MLEKGNTYEAASSHRVLLEVREKVHWKARMQKREQQWRWEEWVVLPLGVQLQAARLQRAEKTVDEKGWMEMGRVLQEVLEEHRQEGRRLKLAVVAAQQ